MVKRAEPGEEEGETFDLSGSVSHWRSGVSIK